MTETQTPKPDLSDCAVVEELFSMAAQEILYRLVQVSRHAMTAPKARDMDDALARHLARTFMAENPEFQTSAAWNAPACARALADAAEPHYSRLLANEPQADLSNPRVVMVLAMSACLCGLYDVIDREMAAPAPSRERIEQQLRAAARRFALAASEPHSAAPGEVL